MHSYVYTKEIVSTPLIACFVVDREESLLKKIYFLYKKKAITAEIYENHPHPEEFIIDNLNIPEKFYDSKVDDDPIVLKSIGSFVLSEVWPVTIKSLVIPKGVTKLEERAFAYEGIATRDVEEVIFSDSIKSIPAQCFENNSYLKNVILPKKVTLIGAFSFARTVSLESIDIPDDCKSIESRAFDSSGVKEIKLGKGIRHIGEYAFYACFNLSTISWPEKVGVIETAVFQQCNNLQTIKLNGTIERVKQCAFSGTSLKEVDFSKNLFIPKISNFAFPKETKLIMPYYSM